MLVMVNLFISPLLLQPCDRIQQFHQVTTSNWSTTALGMESFCFIQMISADQKDHLIQLPHYLGKES